ncbi:MAG: S8 family peptidase [Bacteroidia bacterium]
MRIFYVLLLGGLFLAPAVSASAWLGNQLQDQLVLDQNNQQLFHISLLFEAQSDVQSMLYDFENRQLPTAERAGILWRTLMQQSAQSLGQIQAELERIKQDGQNQLELIESYWIVNMLELKANKSAIEALLQVPGVGRLELADEYRFYLEVPESSNEAPELPNGIEPGLSVIGAPFMWQMGYTGRALRALLIDTGVWPQHQAVGGKYLGNRLPLDQSWLPYILPEPADKSGSHGTHVIGTVLGLDTATRDTIGAAFGAYFIATDPVATSQATSRPILEYVRAYQWALNPDNDTTTTDDIPAVINNSWGRTNSGNDSLCTHPIMVPALLAVEAIGIANVFSAGNNGPNASTTGFLASIVTDTLNVFSVGALDGNNPQFPIAGFSSRGPTTCSTSGPVALAIKPEVSAPGVNVRSADGPTGYGSKSGTSMAAPHVSGAVLLLKEAFPLVSGRQILNALYQTAIDLGAPGEDNVYGRGLISLPAAYHFLAASHTPAAPVSKAYDIAIAGIDSPGVRQIGSGCSNNSTNVPAINQQQVRVLLYNAGDSVLQGFRLIVNRNGLIDTLNSSQSIAPGSYLSYLTPAWPVEPDNQINNWQFRAEPAGMQQDFDPLNNLWHLSFRTAMRTSQLLFENFDTTSTRPTTITHFIADIQVIDQDDDGRSWEISQLSNIPTYQGIGTDYAMGIKMRTYAPRAGQLNDLVLPVFYHLPALGNNLESPNLRFDMAYASRNPSFVDSFFVEVSMDCGSHWQRIYSNGGDSINTFVGVDPSEANHWRNIELPAFLNQLPGGLNISGALYVRFRAKNDFGGNLYLTNIRLVSSSLSSVRSHAAARLLVYPNPASDMLQISSPDALLEQLQLFDMQGRLLRQLPLEGKHSQLNMQQHPAGIYLLRVKTKTGWLHQRIVKS